MIDVKHVSGGYTHETIIQDLSFRVEKGEFFGIIGPNGSGKTTLVKMMSGILPIQKGVIELKQTPISSYQPKELAKHMAVLPQLTTQAFSFTVKETISLGRYAHKKGLFHTFSQEDEQKVQKVMEQTGVLQYENVMIDQLSGGERQRVFLAQALAQDPEVIILDEPTNHLDLAYQKELLDLLKGWTKENKLTVISIFHDLNLAGLYCDRLLLLNKGRMNHCDVPDAVLKANVIQEVYETSIEKHPHPRVPKPQIMLVPDQTKENDDIWINADHIQMSEEMIVLESPIPLKTISSGVTGAGVGWFRKFVNRHVGHDYNCADYKLEMAEFLNRQGFDPHETVGMMTAVELKHVAYEFLEEDGFSLLIIVTAGVSNAVDAAFGKKHIGHFVPGTINTWIFVNGELADEAFIQSIVTATEAKTKALREVQVIDQVTGTLATGTSTDSILVAATQKGRLLDFGGPITRLGSAVGLAVFNCTKKALNKNGKRIRKL